MRGGEEEGGGRWRWAGEHAYRCLYIYILHMPFEAPYIKTKIALFHRRVRSTKDRTNDRRQRIQKFWPKKQKPKNNWKSEETYSITKTKTKTTKRPFDFQLSTGQAWGQATSKSSRRVISIRFHKTKKSYSSSVAVANARRRW